MRNLLVAFVLLCAVPVWAAPSFCVSEEIKSPTRSGVIEYCDVKDPNDPNTLTITIRTGGVPDPTRSGTWQGIPGAILAQEGPFYEDVMPWEMGDLFKHMQEALQTYDGIADCDDWTLGCSTPAGDACGHDPITLAPKVDIMHRIDGSERITCYFTCAGDGMYHYVSCKDPYVPDNPEQPEPCDPDFVGPRECSDPCAPDFPC